MPIATHAQSRGECRYPSMIILLVVVVSLYHLKVRCINSVYLGTRRLPQGATKISTIRNAHERPFQIKPPTYVSYKISFER